MNKSFTFRGADGKPFRMTFDVPNPNDSVQFPTTSIKNIAKAAAPKKKK